jgi:hypothetical protein
MSDRKCYAKDGVCRKGCAGNAPCYSLLEQAVEAQKNDTRTPEQKIKDGVAFITDTRLGGD